VPLQRDSLAFLVNSLAFLAQRTGLLSVAAAVEVGLLKCVISTNLALLHYLIVVTSEHYIGDNDLLSLSLRVLTQALIITPSDV